MSGEIRRLNKIGANGILATFDLAVAEWRVTLLRCLWRWEPGRQWIELPCKAIEFDDPQERLAFEAPILTALNQVMEKTARKPRKQSQ
jgi:hypothetical protein